MSVFDLVAKRADSRGDIKNSSVAVLFSRSRAPLPHLATRVPPNQTTGKIIVRDVMRYYELITNVQNRTIKQSISKEHISAMAQYIVWSADYSAFSMRKALVKVASTLDEDLTDVIEGMGALETIALYDLVEQTHLEATK